MLVRELLYSLSGEFPSPHSLCSDHKDLKLTGVKTPVWFYSYHPEQNGGFILEYPNNSRMQGGRGSSKFERRVVQVSPFVLAELSVEMKALHQPVLLCKGCKMHLSCITGCRAIILVKRRIFH